MTNDKLEYTDLLELLINGPVGGRRRWAACLVLRMLETKGKCHYRGDDRLDGAAHGQTAIASLRAAVRVLSAAEQGLLLRAILTLPWEQLRRSTGLCLRVPEILAELGKELAVLPCLAAAESVVENGDDAVRQYPLDGLLPEVRQPGAGMGQGGPAVRASSSDEKRKSASGSGAWRIRPLTSPRRRDRT